jgi:hypothetical protein
MQRRLITPEPPRFLERALAAVVLFYGALAFCLPVPFSEDVALAYPWWAKRMGIGNVVLHELIFLVWIALYGLRFVLRAFLNRGIPTRQAAFWLIALALWCGTISLAGPLPLLDLGRSFRLLLNAALLFAVVRWTRQRGNFPLGMLILGFLTGTIINLLMSFQNPLIVGGVMRLSGQSTPGVAMGIAIHLSAWLFFRTSHRLVQTFAVIATLVFAFGCGISYSRIGWFCGSMGLMAWTYILIAARPRELKERLRLKKTRRAWIPLVALGLAALLSSPPARENIHWIQTLVEEKLSSASAGESYAYRVYYFVGVAEILASHPFGVGYSGFFDAMTATDIYRSGKAVGELDYTANPHSAFLYYASAGGIPGGLIVIAVFVMLLNSMRHGLVSALGRPGFAFFALAAPSFLLIGLTVPYLVNSIILIVPSAIAGGWGWTRRAEQAASRHLPTNHQHAKKTPRPPRQSPALS